MTPRQRSIVGAYEAALGGRDPGSVSVFDLLPAIYAAVPRVNDDEIVTALRVSAAENLIEADELRRYQQQRHSIHIKPNAEA
jgi:hypothetical protein